MWDTGALGWGFCFFFFFCFFAWVFALLFGRAAARGRVLVAIAESSLCPSGEQGSFPANFTMDLAKVLMVTAMFDYEAQKEHQLTLSQGLKIVLNKHY